MRDSFPLRVLRGDQSSCRKELGLTGAQGLRDRRGYEGGPPSTTDLWHTCLSTRLRTARYYCMKREAIYATMPVYRAEPNQRP